MAEQQTPAATETRRNPNHDATNDDTEQYRVVVNEEKNETIGMELDEANVVTKIVAGSDVERRGRIRQGDWVVGVDGAALKGRKLGDVIKYNRVEHALDMKRPLWEQWGLTESAYNAIRNQLGWMSSWIQCNWRTNS